jgi:solute carrier family 35 (GDP-fucose transporter), member C1
MSNVLLKNFEIFGVVTFYTVTAITSIIANKYFLKSVSVPLTLLELQMAVSTVVLVAGYSAVKLVRRINGQEDATKMTVIETIRMLWPMVVCNVFGLAFNIICLSKIDAIMHQVTRGITLPLTALLGPLLGNDSGSWRVFLVCFAIFSGFVIAVSGEISAEKISFGGIAAGFISSLINAYNAQFVKKRFSTKGFSAIDLVYYNNIYSTILLAPVALAYEGSLLSSVNNWGHVIYASLITGVLGVMINYAGFLQIKVTSAVTHCVSSAARGVFQVAASHLILREHLSITRAVGIGLSLISSSIYPVVKSYDNSLAKKKQYRIVELESIKFNRIDVAVDSK